MKAYLVPETGEVLYPVRTSLGSASMGDGLALAPAGSEEAAKWGRTLVVQPMPERLRPLLGRLRAAQG